MHECVVGALLARATLSLRVGHIVALRQLSQEPLGRERRPGDVYAHKESKSVSSSMQKRATRCRLVRKEELTAGVGRSTRTGRELSQIIHPAVRMEAIEML